MMHRDDQSYKAEETVKIGQHTAQNAIMKRKMVKWSIFRAFSSNVASTSAVSLNPTSQEDQV